MLKFFTKLNDIDNKKKDYGKIRVKGRENILSIRERYIEKWVWQHHKQEC